MRSSDKPTFAVIFLHKGMRYGMEESCLAVSAMESWMIDELSWLGYNMPKEGGGCWALYNGIPGRLVYFSEPELPAWARPAYEPQEFTSAD